MPHKLSVIKLLGAQLDIAKNIQEILKIPQLEGDVELCFQPLTNEHKVKKCFEEPDQTEEAKPQETKAKEEVEKTQPKANPRKNDANRKKTEDNADKPKDSTHRSLSLSFTP